MCFRILKDQSLSTDVQGHALNTLQDKLNEAEAALRHQQELFHRTEVSGYVTSYLSLYCSSETLTYEEWKEGLLLCMMFVQSEEICEAKASSTLAEICST